MVQMPSRARAGTAHEARLAYRAGPARQTGPRAVLVHRARHVGRPGPARLVIRANRAGPNRAGPDRARAGSGRARPVGQLYRPPPTAHRVPQPSSHHKPDHLTDISGPTRNMPHMSRSPTTHASRPPHTRSEAARPRINARRFGEFPQPHQRTATRINKK